MAIRHYKKISELDAITSASLSTYVAGVDNGQTVRITLDVLADGVRNTINTLDIQRLNALESSTGSYLTNAALNGVVSSSQQIENLGFITSSGIDTNQFATTSSFNEFSQLYNTDSASFDERIIAATNEQDLSYLLSTASFNEFTSSQKILNTAFNNGINARLQTSSFNEFTQSQNILNATWATTGSNAFNGDQIISGTVFLSGSLIPSADSTLTSSFSLGSSTNAWRDIWVSKGTIHFVGDSGSVVDTLSTTANGLAMTNLELTSNLVASGSITARTISGEINATNGVISGSTQILDLGFATTGSNTFYGNQTIRGAIATNVMMNPQDLIETTIIPSGYNGLLISPVGTNNEIIVEDNALLVIL